MSLEDLAIAVMNGHAPCDAFDKCRHYEQCRDFELACGLFTHYVKRHVPMHQRNIQPNRSWYEKVFNETE